MTQTQARVTLTRGKFTGLNSLSNENGIIAAAAMDQRGSLKKALGKAKGGDVGDQDLEQFKTLVTEVLTPYATAILLDPEYGLEAAKHRAPNAGLLLAYEQSGYDTTTPGRLPDLLPEWSAYRLVQADADAVKILLYYDPDDDERINTIKHAFIERVGAECRANDVPFFLEPVTYTDQIADAKGIEYARVKPDKVLKTIREFSQLQYGVDVLKVEVPINMQFVEGTQASAGGPAAYSRDQAIHYFKETARAARVPFIYLTAGVSNEVFQETLRLVNEAGVPYSGVLAGRATWQDGVPVYAQGGPDAFRRWLEDQGVRNIKAINDLVYQGAQPWWTIYGGRDNLDVIDSEVSAAVKPS